VAIYLRPDSRTGSMREQCDNDHHDASSSKVTCRYDAVGMHLSAFIDRDILSGRKTFICKMEPDLVWRFLGCTVVEYPAAALAVDEMADAIFLTRAQPYDPAYFAVLAPKRRVDPIVAVERCDDDIGNAGIAFRMARLARELDANLVKLCRKRCVQDRFWMCAWHGHVAFWMDLIISILLRPSQLMQESLPVFSEFGR
jgi:hypothetical protein